MYISVPKEISPDFERLFLKELLQALDAIKYDFNRWPDKMVFKGKIGKELVELIKRKKWDFAIPIEYKQSGEEMLIITHKEKVKTERWEGAAYGESLNGKQIEGIPSNAQVANLMSAYLNPSYKVEKDEYPTLEIKLIRI